MNDQSKLISSIHEGLREIDPKPLSQTSVEVSLAYLTGNSGFQNLIKTLATIKPFAPDLSEGFKRDNVVRSVAALRQLKCCYNLRLGKFFTCLAELAESVAGTDPNAWYGFADRVCQSDYQATQLKTALLETTDAPEFRTLFERLEEEDPHAIYPTSEFRSCSGSVSWSSDDLNIEAVMTTSTMTQIHILEGVLDPGEPTLRRIYQPLGRCVCLIDHNVDEHYREQLETYFETHHIDLECLVYRAMEVDKSIGTVERILGDFKRIGVSRNEPVLIAGGGVLADVGGLACGLFHRNTPYVMLATSIVSGIDAGPSPRTCCDGFGYKNLFGVYHAPIMTLTDRTFFRTLHTGWLRHGIAEIIKMAVVKDAKLFHLLETADPNIIHSRFGTTPDKTTPDIISVSNAILGAAMRSYVESEYGNLYETHQCRPHAYGHTWSPGFEIAAGLLHGHAVACGMGFGAFLSRGLDWISEGEFKRILGVISRFELSLWHDILDDYETIWQAQVRMVEKRGGNLSAPLPKGGIGKCGYLNELSRADLEKALSEYKKICVGYPREGRGIEPLCSDVGLEDPSTVHCEFHESDPIGVAK